VSDSYFKTLEAAGHTLQRDGDGHVDIFVLDVENHNGPGCTTCGDAWCHHCQDTPTRCDGGVAKKERERVGRIRDAAEQMLDALRASQRLAPMRAELDDIQGHDGHEKDCRQLAREIKAVEKQVAAAIHAATYSK